MNAGIRYLQIETEVKDDPNTRQVAWFFTPDNGKDEWQFGRVNLKRGQPYKIVITAHRSNALLGYVAVDDFDFEFNGEECTIMPENARPTTPTSTSPTTSVPQGTFPDCKFEHDTCGWVINEFADMKWKITNTEELAQSGEDSPKGDFDGNFIYVNAATGNLSSNTILATEMRENPVEGCLIFFFSLFVSYFVTKSDFIIIFVA